MSLLCVTVKRAKLQGSIEEFHSYVTLKLQNVKSTTVAVRGIQPQWEQEFIFETNRLDQALFLELWNKGVLWDKLLGVCFMRLCDIGYSNSSGCGKWLQVDHEFRTLNGDIVGTLHSTGHSVLVDCRFELPFEVPEQQNVSENYQYPQDESSIEDEEEDEEEGEDEEEISQKEVELINLEDYIAGGINRSPEENLPINGGGRSRRRIAAEAINQRAQLLHSGISEDSDYTSEISFQPGAHQQQQHQANASAHQYESHLRRTTINQQQEPSASNRLVPSDNYFPSTSSNIQWDTSEYSQQQQYVPESLLYTQQQQRHNQRLFHPNLVDSRNTPPSPTPQYFADGQQQYYDEEEQQSSQQYYTDNFDDDNSQSDSKTFDQIQNIDENFYHGGSQISSSPFAVSSSHIPRLQSSQSCSRKEHRNGRIGGHQFKNMQEVFPSPSFTSSVGDGGGGGGSGRAGFTDSRSSNSTVQQMNESSRRSRAGNYYDSESDGFTSTGTVVPVNIHELPNWRTTITQQHSQHQQDFGRLNEEKKINNERRKIQPTEQELLAEIEEYKAKLAAAGRHYDSQQAGTFNSNEEKKELEKLKEDEKNNISMVPGTRPSARLLEERKENNNNNGAQRQQHFSSGIGFGESSEAVGVTHGMDEDYGIGYEDPLRGQGVYYTRSGQFPPHHQEENEINQEYRQQQEYNDSQINSADDLSKQQINNTIPPRISLSCENEQRPTKDYLQLWKWAYREACKQAGIT
uniref:C2 domain-containing protein n=1 Tax=Meloidogyne javanica TaxID=6303 RepID=A0A915LJF0_MELJA